MSVGLIRSETASDLRTLTATGASSTTRRERVAAALTARTFGELRSVMADLPEPAHARRPPPAAMPRPVLGLRSPLIPLLAALAMLCVLLIPGRWPIIAFLEAVLVTALIAGPAAATRFRRRMRRH